jgi:hypothetical protein
MQAEAGGERRADGTFVEGARTAACEERGYQLELAVRELTAAIERLQGGR